MLVEVAGVLIADHPHGLSREGPADGGPVLLRPHQRILVAGHGPCFGGGDEPGADPHPVGSEGQGGGQPSSVEDASGGHHRDLGAHRIHDLGYEGHCGHQPGVATGLGALGHHDVAPGVEGPSGMVHLPAHVDDEDAVAVTQLDHFGRYSESGHEHRGAPLDDPLDLSHQIPGHRRQQIDAERLVGGPAHGGDLGDHLLGGHGRGPEAPEPPGLGHRGDERGVGHPTHAGQHDRVVDAEHVGQSGLHLGLLGG